MVRPYDDVRAEEVLEGAKRQILAQFVEFFRQPDYLRTLTEGSIRIKGSKIKVVRVAAVADLAELLYGHGFYVIATNFPLPENPCTYRLGRRLTAIYRGQGELLRLRVESHLFHDYHLAQERKKTYEVSLMLNDQHVNVDQLTFLNYTWTVVQHPMTDASQVVREQMELAFDQVFTKPAACER